MNKTKEEVKSIVSEILSENPEIVEKQMIIIYLSNLSKSLEKGFFSKESKELSQFINTNTIQNLAALFDFQMMLQKHLIEQEILSQNENDLSKHIFTKEALEKLQNIWDNEELSADELIKMRTK